MRNRHYWYFLIDSFLSVHCTATIYILYNAASVRSWKSGIFIITIPLYIQVQLSCSAWQLYKKSVISILCVFGECMGWFWSIWVFRLFLTLLRPKYVCLYECVYDHRYWIWLARVWQMDPPSCSLHVHVVFSLLQNPISLYTFTIFIYLHRQLILYWFVFWDK